MTQLSRDSLKASIVMMPTSAKTAESVEKPLVQAEVPEVGHGGKQGGERPANLNPFEVEC